jgi:hypothetical protein
MGKLNMWLNGSTYGANLPVWKAWTLRKFLILTGVVALLAIVGSVVYALVPNEPPRVKVACVGELGDDYYTMSEREIICKLEKETGLDIRDLLDKKQFKESTFKSFKEAETSARALYGMAKWRGDKRHEAYVKSVNAYTIAEGKVTGGAELNHAFYNSYANAALYAQDKELYNRLTEKAKTSIQNDSTLSDARKTELLEEIEGQKKIMERSD